MSWDPWPSCPLLIRYKGHQMYTGILGLRLNFQLPCHCDTAAENGQSMVTINNFEGTLQTLRTGTPLRRSEQGVYLLVTYMVYTWAECLDPDTP